jgi:hypothetical protein
LAHLFQLAALLGLDVCGSFLTLIHPESSQRELALLGF